MNQVMWTPEKGSTNRMRTFSHYAGTAANAPLPNYSALHQWSVNHPDEFWSSIWDFFEVKGYKGSRSVENMERMPGARWFPEARLNFAENLLAHANELGEQTAIIEYSERGKQLELSYAELLERAAKLAAFFKSIGVSHGDRVAAITTNSHHAIVGMLACTSLGAIWSSCSPDFGVNGILDRFSQIQPKVLLCCTRYQYAGKDLQLDEKLTEITSSLDTLLACVHFDPFSDASTFACQIKTIRYEEVLQDTEEVELSYAPCHFDDPLYILFSSGTTGRPKCIVHGVGGTLLQHLKELGLHTNLNRGDRLFYFTTCGWMMWNWYISALALGCTLVCYDGSPFHPNNTVLFDLAETEKLNVFGASAKYFAACEKFDVKPVKTHELDSLESILSTGSPLAPESFDYLYQQVKPTARVSSISGGTDIVSCFALGNPDLPVNRGELQGPGLGMDLAFFDDNGKPISHGKGELVCQTSFPSMPVGFWNDPDNQKYNAAYFERFNGVWAHGDFGEFCPHELEDGSIQQGVMIHGRSDAVLNPSGVRIGTAEIYRQVEQVPAVFESLAVGQKWQDDERIVLFVRLIPGQSLTQELIEEIKRQIRQNTSPRHVPAKIIEIDDIPRTRSGKIVELAVRNVIHDEEVNNTEALANPEALALYENIEALKT